MCLQRLDDFNVKLNKDDIGSGWKVFVDGNCGKLHGEYHNSGERPTNKWLNEKQFRGMGFTNPRWKKIMSRYPFGWHIFPRKEDAVKWICGSFTKVIKKVKFRNVVATGYQIGYKVIVAKEIYIPKQ